MSISATSEQERAKFTEFCSKRTLDNFNYVVQVTHQDGSVFILHNSSLWVSEVLSTEGLPRFIGVATEHTGNYFFFVDDLYSWSKMRQI